MPAKKKINNEGKPTEINIKNDMKRGKQIEEKLNECIDISEEDESETNESNETNETNETVETKQSISTTYKE